MEVVNMVYVIVAAALSGGVAWGINQQKIRNLEEDLEDFKSLVDKRFEMFQTEQKKISDLLIRLDERTQRMDKSLSEIKARVDK